MSLLNNSKSSMKGFDTCVGIMTGALVARALSASAAEGALQSEWPSCPRQIDRTKQGLLPLLLP